MIPRSATTSGRLITAIHQFVCHTAGITRQEADHENRNSPPSVNGVRAQEHFDEFPAGRATLERLLQTETSNRIRKYVAGAVYSRAATGKR